VFSFGWAEFFPLVGSVLQFSVATVVWWRWL